MAQMTKLQKSLKCKIVRLEKELQSRKMNSIYIEEDVSKYGRTFAKMIATCHQQYDEKERDLAQNLHFVSAKCYAFMRETLEFRLPSVSSLCNWRPIRRVLPGDDPNVRVQIGEKLKSMSQEDRLCTLIFDEVSVRPDLEYDNKLDYVVGCNDNGRIRGPKVATKALVVMVKGIISRWKIAISYYALSSVPSTY